MKKILIIEDQADIRRLLSTTLEVRDCLIKESVDAEAGWAEVLRWQPDLVLLDIMLPGAVDGLQLCQRLKETAATRDVKVMLVSARGHRNDMHIGRYAGADDYLLKPFSPSRLLDVVDRLLMPA